MWMRVLRADTGVPITNARFNYNFYNDGNGWYWVYIGWNQSFICSASGFNSLWGSTDSYSYIVLWLTVYTPPPPPSGGGGWT